jgi:hypothetical protein
MRYLNLCLFLILISISCNRSEKISSTLTTVSSTSSPGITGNVADAQNGEILSARIVISDSTGEVLQSYYNHLNGFFTNDDGTFEYEVAPGKYTVSVYHGIDYLSEDIEIEIEPDQGVELNIFLKKWVPLKDKGWASGGGHCHLYTNIEQDDEMIAKVRNICLAQGIDFVCAAQGWAGYDDSTWQKGYAKFSDDRFMMHYGSEMPKYRTGHTWWIGQTSTLGYYWNTMDENYEEKYYQSESGTAWSFDDISFPYIPDIEVVQGFKRKDNTVAIMAHPTSWWMQERGDIKKYTTNVCSYLSFGLLAGKIWDGLVVMGYNHDHYQYQNLWFNILDQGYRMPAISELDGGLGKNDRFYYGSMRTYYKLNGEFSMSNVADAVRRGETFVTSGPIIEVDIDEKYKIGDIITIDESEHTMNIEAFASGDKDDYLSYVVVYRNSKIYKLWDLRKDKLRTFSESLEINEDQQAWYLVKAYGRKAWEDPENLDITVVCDKSLDQKTPPFQGDLHDVCITSPFYFWPEGIEDPTALESEVDLQLLTVDGAIVENAKIDLLVNGSVVKSIELKNGSASFSMPIHGLLRISTSDKKKIYRGLYLDYKPHLDLLEKLASGRWLNDYKNAGINYASGEVPWEAFNYKETKKILSKVNWEIVFTPNSRDPLWEEFEQKFNSN